MFDLLTTSPTCQTLTLSSYLAGFAGDAVRTALESSGYFPDRYISALEDASFYCNLRNYILYDSILDKWMMFVVNNLAKVIMAMSTAFVTLWVLMAGFKMMSGTQREPVIELMFRGAKIIFVLALVSGMMGNTDTIVHTVLGLQSSVAKIVTGSSESLDSLIDMNIGITQVINMVTEDVTNATAQQENKTGGLSIFAGLLGQSGPAILTSVLVLLAQIAIVFALMLAPLFIFFLLFKETSSLFWGWAKFLLASFLSLSFLAIISTIAMSATLSYGLTVMVSFVLNAVADSGDAAGAIAEGIIMLINGSQRVDMSGAAMRMAMMGGLFATLIVAVPPMIMQMFNASIGYASNLMGSMGIIRPMGGMNPGAAPGGQVGGQSTGNYLGNSNAMPGLARLGGGGQAHSSTATLIAKANGNSPSSHPGGETGVNLTAGSVGVNRANPATFGLGQVQGKSAELGTEFRSGSVAAPSVGVTGSRSEGAQDVSFREGSNAPRPGADGTGGLLKVQDANTSSSTVVYPRNAAYQASAEAPAAVTSASRPAGAGQAPVEHSLAEKSTPTHAGHSGASASLSASVKRPSLPPGPAGRAAVVKP